MRPTGASLTREQFRAIFELPDEVIDALIREGHLLCQFSGGEQRIPLEQIEAFFRDNLMRLYQTRAWLSQSGFVIAEQRVVQPEPMCEREEPAAPFEPERAVKREESPETPQASAPAESDDQNDDEPEYRRTPRYVPRRQLDGIFNDVRFTIVQLSSTGLRIRHKEPLVPGDEAKVSFALIRPPRSIVFRARVVWTSVARYENGGDTFSISGLRVIDHPDRLAGAIDVLRAAHDLQPERRSKPRPTLPESGEALLEGVSDDEVAAVMKAIQRFASDPVEANRWYSRARFALSDENVRKAAPPKPRDRDEVLGLWEYLERRIEVGKVAGVVAWARKARSSA